MWNDMQRKDQNGSKNETEFARSFTTICFIKVYSIRIKLIIFDISTEWNEWDICMPAINHCFFNELNVYLCEKLRCFYLILSLFLFSFFISSIFLFLSFSLLFSFPLISFSSQDFIYRTWLDTNLVFAFFL